MQIALLTGIMAMVVMPLAASADVILTVSPDAVSVSPSTTVTLSLFMTTEVGTSTDNATWSVGCDAGCSIQSFVFNEAYGAGSGLVTWGPGKTAGPFATGLPNLNTTGSFPSLGDGSVIGDGSYVGSIGFLTPTAFLNGDGQAYLIGTLTVHASPGGVVTPFFRPGEGIFSGPPAVPTQFVGATIGHIPEPGTASLLALGLGGLALLGRRNRS